MGDTTTKKIMQEILICGECKYFARGFLGEPSDCTYSKETILKYVERSGPIPDWCPLLPTEED